MNCRSKVLESVCLALALVVLASNVHADHVQLMKNTEEDNVVQWKPLIDDRDDSLLILYSDNVPMTNLVRNCIRSIPFTYRERCLLDSFERYDGSVFPLKSRCCTKWAQISCLEKYAYNTIYCNMHQQLAVSRYFDQIRSTKHDGSPECTVYRPVEEEEKLWSSKLGRTAKCATKTSLNELS